MLGDRAVGGILGQVLKVSKAMLMSLTFAFAVCTLPVLLKDKHFVQLYFSKTEKKTSYNLVDLTLGKWLLWPAFHVFVAVVLL